MAVDQNSGKLEPPLQNNSEDYENLLDDYSHFAPPAEDEVLEGTVLKITAKEVIVDFGYKSEGVVPIEQFTDPAAKFTVQPGDVVDVMIDTAETARRLRAALPREGRAPQSLGQPRKGHAGAAHHLRPRAGPRQGRPFGGCRASAFMPGSQVDPRPVRNLDSSSGRIFRSRSSS